MLVPCGQLVRKKRPDENDEETNETQKGRDSAQSNSIFSFRKGETDYHHREKKRGTENILLGKKSVLNMMMIIETE